MDKIKIWIALLASAITTNAGSLVDEKPETIDPIVLQEKLANLDVGRNSIKTARKVVCTLKFHVDVESLASVRHVVPATNYILRSYDQNLIPYLLEYGLEVDNRHLKRRAVYCIEQLYGDGIAVFFEERFGKDSLAIEKFKILVDSSKNETFQQIEKFKAERTEMAQYIDLYTRYVNFFVPQMTESEWNLKIPHEKE